MAKLKINVDVTGAKEVKDLDKSFKLLETSSKSVDIQNQKTSSSMASMAIKGALVVSVIYTMNKAMNKLVSDGFTYNKSLEESKQGLIALSVAIQDKAIPVIDRYSNATREATYTLAELQKINAETPHTLNETNKIYKAMYVSMRGVGATTDELINLTKKLSIAAGAAGIDFNSLLAGVDGLATGTVLANSDLGRFLGGLGLTNKALKETDDVMGLVTAAFEDFKAADTMAVALSNVNNAWSIFAGNITQPVFEGVKKSLNLVSEQMNKYGPQAMQTFSDTLVDMVNAGVKSVGFLAKALNQLVGIIQIAYSGYQKYIGLVMGGDTTKLVKRLESQLIGQEHDIKKMGGARAKYWKESTEALIEEITITEEYNNMRRDGDELHAKALERTNAINELINSGIEKMTINYGKVPEKIEEQEKPLENVFKKIKIIGKEQDKNAKKAKKDAKDLAKVQDKAMDEATRALQTYNERFADGFAASMQAVLDGDLFNAFNTFFGSISDTMVKPFIDDLSKKLSTTLSDLMGGLGAFGSFLGGAALSFGLQAISGLLSTTVSQTEIEAAVGRVEFTDNSLRNLEKIYEEAQYPMLDITKEMNKYLRNMDANFYSIAKVFSSEASAKGVDLTGVNFVETLTEGFLGFSSKAVSLIGTGLRFELQNLSDMMNEAEINVRAYTTTLVQETSWWGLTSSEKIKETYKDLPEEVVRDMANSFAWGYEMLMTSGVSLGLDKVDLEKALKAAEIDLGEIDFTGLSPEEINKRLEQAFGTAFSGVVDQIPELSALVDRYTQGVESSLETLGRIAVEYDQASHMFGLIGKDFTDTIITVNDLTNNLGSSLGGFFGLILNVMGDIVIDTYTAQEQMLDIVESAGGLTNFQDAMSAYMGNFYTETEQLGFLTNSMEQSFIALGLTMPNIGGSADEANAEFRKLLEGIDTSTKEGAYLYGQVLLLAEGFNAMTTASEDLAEANKALQQEEEDRLKAINVIYQAEIKSYTEAISSLMLGSYSNLSAAVKMEFAEGYTKIARASEGTISIIDALRSEMEVAFKYATTQEEYGVYVDRLASQLRREVPEATNDDIVARLDTLIEYTFDLNESIKMTA